MSDLSSTIQSATRDQLAARRGAEDASGRTRRRVAMLVALAILAWSVVELVSLAFRHTTGPELYGVLVAALAVVAAVLNLVLLTATQKRTWAVVATVALWAIVALGGVGGVAAHVIGPDPQYGPVDPRPRPIWAPLAFTAMGAVGGLALVIGRRAGTTRLRMPGEER